MFYLKVIKILKSIMDWVGSIKDRLGGGGTSGSGWRKKEDSVGAKPNKG